MDQTVADEVRQFFADKTVVVAGVVMYILCWPVGQALTVNDIDGPPPTRLRISVYIMCIAGFLSGIALLWLLAGEHLYYGRYPWIRHPWWAALLALVYIVLGLWTNDKIDDWEDGCSD